MTDLLVAPVAAKAARVAVRRWHYSGSLPFGISANYGVWEDGRFIGAVVFARGANPNLHTSLGLKLTECVELVRVALASHKSPVSQIVALALRRLRHDSPGIRLVVSFADPEHGHHGGIYQAGNWIYTGTSKPGHSAIVRGRKMHGKTVETQGWRISEKWLRENVDPNARVIQDLPKFRYLMPMDKATRRRYLPRALPYPVRPATSGALQAVP